jgi:1-acyl-sn-glycerol-3-phosphate acyltransferase
MNSRESKKPNQLLTTILWLIFKPYLKFAYNFKYNNDVIKDIKGPAVFIGNHASVLDVFLMGVSAYPKFLNYVAGYDWFTYFGLSFILKHLKAIPKFQYQIDLASIKEMIEVINQNQILGIFPTGRLASAGVGLPVDDNVAKLIKKLKAPVYFFKIDGAYLSRPKWAIKPRRGKIEARYYQIFNVADLANKDVEEITKIINQYMVYDDYAWNKEKAIVFKGKRLAENLEKVLFLCPKCHQEFSLHTNNDVITCSCGYNNRVLTSGFFEDKTNFESPKDWNLFQKNVLKEQIINKELAILSQVKVYSTTTKDKHKSLFGEGHVTLVDDYLIFRGKIESEVKELKIRLSDFPSLPFKAGHNFEISQDQFIYKFVLKNGNEAAKWSLIAEALHEVKTIEQ